MKIGSGDHKLEGSPKEITDLLEDHGLDLKQFFRTEEPPISGIWIVLAAISLLIVACLLVILPPAQQKLAFIVGLFLVLTVAALIQLRFKSVATTVIVGIGGIVMLLAALGVLSPAEVLKEAKELRPGK